MNLGSAGRTVSSLAVGWYHALAIAADGALLSWGSNLYGQLGLSTNAGTNQANAAPAVIPAASYGGGSVAAVAAGGDHSLILKGDGSVYAFGSNFRGQLGTVLKYEQWGGVTHVPTRLILPTASAVAAGRSHSLVLTAEGLFGTGSNIYGQLADPTDAGDRAALLGPHMHTHSKHPCTESYQWPQAMLANAWKYPQS